MTVLGVRTSDDSATKQATAAQLEHRIAGERVAVQCNPAVGGLLHLACVVGEGGGLALLFDDPTAVTEVHPSAVVFQFDFIPGESVVGNTDGTMISGRVVARHTVHASQYIVRDFESQRFITVAAADIHLLNRSTISQRELQVRLVSSNYVALSSTSFPHSRNDVFQSAECDGLSFPSNGRRDIHAGDRVLKINGVL